MLGSDTVSTNITMTNDSISWTSSTVAIESKDMSLFAT